MRRNLALEMLIYSPSVSKRQPLSQGFIEYQSDSQTVLFWIHWRGWIRVERIG